MSFDFTTLKTEVQARINAVGESTTALDLVKLSKLADLVGATRTTIDAQIQSRLNNVGTSTDDLDILMFAKSALPNAIKSIQRGLNRVIPSDLHPDQDITIDAVNMNKSILLSSVSIGSIATGSVVASAAAVALLNSTTIRFNFGGDGTNSGENRTTWCAWQVIEYV